LLVDLDGSYAVLSIEDIARRVTSVGNPLNQPVSAFAGAACPIVDVEQELEDAQAQLANSVDVLVLRASEPYGVLTSRPMTAPTSAARLLLSQAAGWTPPIQGAAVLGVEESIPKAPVTPPAPIEPIQPRADRYVNTDFASEQQPAQALDRKQALQPGQSYFFRLNVGELEPATTIEIAPEQLPDFITQQDVELVIVLFSEHFVIEQPTGVLSVPATGLATVKTPASLPSGMDADAPLAQERLLFRVIAPRQHGRADLRVNMYCNGMLVQSRLVTAVIGAGEPLNGAGLMRGSVLDFNLSPALAPSHLADIAPHKLSLMLNSNGDGDTHAFRVFAQDGKQIFENSTAMLPSQLTDLLNQSRNVLQQVAWGYMGGWDQRTPYRYEMPAAAESNWRTDVIALAVQGYRIYDSRIRNLAGNSANEDKLRELLRTPGMVQLASKASASDVLPIAMIYDFDLDTQNPQALTICPQFEASLQSGRDLLSEPCFLGNCPNREEHFTVVCPSGFWGFRHDIGMPWSAASGPEMAKTIVFTGEPQVDIAYYQFPNLGQHLENVAALGFQAQRQEGRDQAIEMFKTTSPQVVYFYCHGVTIKQDAQTSIPALMIGSQNASGFFDTSNFRARRIRWPQARPLVMINGCHTTDISPDQALSFVQTFIEYVEAAGVIGTQITIFEPLAQRFAESFLQAFRAGQPLGRAIRTARLQLLAQRNPLGLVYQPFAYAGLKLVAG
nr:CHAT domain-containing protein [Chloroflexota bacterium]